MAYFNNDSNTNFYSTSSTFGEFEEYPFLGQTSATEGANIQAHHALADHWSMTERSEPMMGSSTGYWTAANQSVVSTTAYTTHVDGYGQPSYSGYQWPAVGYQAETYHPGFLSRDTSFTDTVTSEAFTVAPTPSNFPFSYWGDNQSGPSQSTFYEQNVQPLYHPSIGPTRIRQILPGRFQPYRTTRARLFEYENAEAGPSILVPPLVPYADLSTLQPSGGISETTADAVTTQTVTEEGQVPVSKRTRRPRGQGPPRLHRAPAQKDASKLCDWVQRRKDLREVPSLNRALTVAAEIIPTIRPLANLRPCLLTGHGKRTAVGSRSADGEHERRKVERELLQNLSRYYPLEPNQKVWSRQPLLALVWRDLEALP